MSLISAMILLLSACGDQPQEDLDPADPTPYISILDVSANEGQTFVFNVTLNKSAPQPVTFNYYSADSSALAPLHYGAISGNISLNIGSSFASVTVVTNDNPVDNNNRAFYVVLSSLTGAKASDLSAIGTILDDDAPAGVYISDASPVTEGQTSYFTISLSPSSDKSITVYYSTVNETAVASGDYTSKTAMALLPAGVSVATITILTSNDNIYELAETFAVTLTTVLNGTKIDAYGVATISDDGDSLSNLGITNPSVNEGETLKFAVTLSKQSGVPVTFYYADIPLTAAAGVDYISTSGGQTIPSGSLSVVINVPTVHDTGYESNETLQITLSSVTNANTVSTLGTGTIINNDSLPQLRVSDGGSPLEGSTIQFIASISSPSLLDTSFSYSTADISATAGSDYTAISGSATIPAGSLNLTFAVYTTDDVSAENTETFNFNVSLISNASGADTSGTASILDNDTMPDIFVSNASISESGTLNFTISLSFNAVYDVVVDYTTADQTAINSDDYLGTSGTLTIAVGQKTIGVPVASIHDTLDEDNEIFLLSIVSHTNSNPNDLTGSGTITDNDPIPTIWISNSSTTEGQTADFIVSLNTVSGRQIRLNYNTANGSASASSDFTATSGSVTMQPGESQVTLSIATVDDFSPESSETFTLSLSSLMNVAAGDISGSGTINDNDSGTLIFVQSTSAIEGGTLEFVVSLSSVDASNIEFDYSTSDNTAGSLDYAPDAGTLTIPTGELAITIFIDSLSDSLDEDSEIFNITLTNLVGASPAQTGALGTINDDDATPSLWINDSTSVTEGQTAEFIISLSSVSGRQIRFNYNSYSGSASSSSDFTAILGSVTLQPGDEQITLSVSTIDDVSSESSENFTISLSSLMSVVAGDINASGTIDDNDVAVTLSVYDSAATEGSPLGFIVSLDSASGSNITFNYSTNNNTALSGSDYTSTSGTATILAGATGLTILVNSLSDSFDESNETFNITLTSLSGASAGQTGAIGTINDDDPTPSIYVSDAGASEGSNLTFIITASGLSQQSMTFNYQTVDGSATSSDYSSVSGTLTILSGSSAISLIIASTTDGNLESDETFTISFSSLTNALAGDIVGLGTITNVIPPLGYFSIVGVSDPTSAGQANTVIVAAYDTFNNVKADYRGTVTFLSSDGAANLPSNYAFTAGDSGIHTFASGVVLKTVGIHYVRTEDVIDSGKYGQQNNIDVTPGSIDHFNVSGISNPSFKYDPQTAVVIAYDFYNNLKTDYLGTIHFSSDDGLASLPSDYTFNGADNGTHTFAMGAVVFNSVGVFYLKAHDMGNTLASGQQSNITIQNTCAPDHWHFEPLVGGTPTLSVAAGVAFQVRVTAHDVAHSTDTYCNGSKSVSWNMNGSTASAFYCGETVGTPDAPNTSTITFTSGVADTPAADAWFTVKESTASITGSVVTGSMTISGYSSAVTVDGGTVCQIYPRSLANNAGSVLNSSSIDLDNKFTAYAAGYDKYQNFYGDVSVTWNENSANGAYSSPQPGNSSNNASYADVVGVKVTNAGVITLSYGDGIGGKTQAINVTVTAGANTIANWDSTTVDNDGALNHYRLGSSSILTNFYWNTEETTDTWRSSGSQSWYTESHITDSRGARKEFPKRVFLFGTAGGMDIVDATNNHLFMRFVLATGNAIDSALGSIKSIGALNGKIYVGMTSGLVILDFANDRIHKLNSAGAYLGNYTLSQRNDGAINWGSPVTTYYASGLTGNAANDVAVRRHTNSVDFIAVGSATAVDLLKDTGSGAVSIYSSTGSASVVSSVHISSDEKIYFAQTGVGVTRADVDLDTLSANFAGSITYSQTSTAKLPSLTAINDIAIGESASPLDPAASILFVGTDKGLTAIREHSTLSSAKSRNYAIQDTSGSRNTNFNSYIKTGSNGCITIPSTALGTGKATFEFFFKPETTMNSATASTVLFTLGGSATNSSFSVGYNLTVNGGLMAKARRTNPSTTYVTGPNVTLTAGRWYHIAAEWDGTAKAYTLYLDGAKIGGNGTFGTSYSLATTNRQLGCDIGGANPAVGAYDEFRLQDGFLWNQIASITVPTSQYSSSGVALFHFNDDDMTSVTDDSPSLSNGALQGAAWPEDDSIVIGTSDNFTGVDIYKSGTIATVEAVASGTGGAWLELSNAQNPSLITRSNSSTTINGNDVFIYQADSLTDLDVIISRATGARLIRK